MSPTLVVRPSPSGLSRSGGGSAGTAGGAASAAAAAASTAARAASAAAAAAAPARSALAGPAPSHAPARASSRPTPAPAASLQSVDWSRRAIPGCLAPRRDAPVYGDLDRDGRLEAALPVRCTGTDGKPVSRVLVYASAAPGPRLLGEALSASDHGRLGSMEVRDAKLLVASLTWSGADRSGAPDIAVTTRWTVAADALKRTDRWVDPAAVLDADDGDAGLQPGD